MSELEMLKLLYVEDDKNTRDSLSYYLKKRAGKLVSAGTGEEALRQYEIHKPEILIVDLLLPDMNGMEMIRKVRRIDSDCRIIITSSVEKTDVILKTVDMRIDGYIIKPIDPKMLTEKLEESARMYFKQSKRNKAVKYGGMPIEKRTKEAQIKKQFLDLLKKKAGRGARDVMVSWIGDTVEITAYDAYTTIEKTLAEDIRNYSSIEQFRRLFYNTIIGDIEYLIKDGTKMETKRDAINIYVAKRMDQLVFKCDI